MPEFDWIEKNLSHLTNGEPGTFDLKNDGAILRHDPECDLIVTTDTLIEGTHFLPGEQADTIARKSLRVNLSDLASMGAKPLCYTLNLALTRNKDNDLLDLFCSGLIKDQKEFGVYLLGGDTTSGDGLLTITITCFGQTPKRAAWSRSQAQAGDYIYVTGAIGEGLLGLYLRQGIIKCDDKDLKNRLINRHLVPNPRTNIHRLQANACISAAIDISDGLAADLGHVCQQSKVSANLHLRDLPIAQDVRRFCENQSIPIADLATGGDDYELVLCVREDMHDVFLKASKSFSFPFTKIGQFSNRGKNYDYGVRLIADDGSDITLAKTGWTHF